MTALWAVGLEPMERVRREPAVGIVDSEGYPVAPTTTTLTFDGTRDPVPGFTLSTLPEGERIDAVWLIITETDLRAGDDNRNILPDYVLLDGDTWEVRASQKFPRVIPHYEARIMRIKTP